MRFATLNNSITAPGSWQAGIRDVNSQFKRTMLQIDATSPFQARVYATLNFDYDTNIGGPWTEVTDRVRQATDSAPNWIIIGSTYQLRDKASEFGLPITLPGLYAFDPDFFPAAFSVHVTSVTSGDALKLHFGA